MRDVRALVTTLALVVAALPVWAQPGPPAGATVVDAPQFSYLLEDVRFRQARNISVGAGLVRRQQMVRVVIRGGGFVPRATGPVVWLNRIPTLRTQVAEDGAVLEAYFLETVHALEQAAARLGRWELLMVPHEGASEMLRISPSGDPSDAGHRPAISSVTE